MRSFVRPILVAAVAALAALAGAGTAAAAGPSHDRVERAIVAAIDRERAQHGLPGVGASSALARAADEHSRSMARRGSLEHGAFAARVRRVAPRGPIGETIARTPGHGRALAAHVVGMWMRSPPHRAILLERQMRRIGVGRRAGPGGWYVTADFAG